MTGKVLSENSNGILILIFPIAAGIILLYKVWPFLLLLLFLIILWRVWDSYQWSQVSQQVNPFFNQLIQENQGCLTAMDLSMKTNMSSRSAKRFLDRKAEEYGALRKDRGEEGIVYYFLTATALGSIFDDSEPEALLESDRPSLAYESQTVTETSTTTEVTETEPEISASSPQETVEVTETTSDAEPEISASSPQETVEVRETEVEVTETTSDAEPEISASSPQETVEVRETEVEVTETTSDAEPEISASSPQETVTEEQSTSAPEVTPDAPKTSSSSPFAQLAAIKEERQQASDSPTPDTVTEKTTVPQTPSSQNKFSKGLIQADLAKRLDLNPSTVGRRKSDPDFAEWSQSKDPDGIAWRYVRKRRLFIPVEN